MRMLLACLSFVVFAPLATARRLGGYVHILFQMQRQVGCPPPPRGGAAHTLCVVGRRQSGYTRKSLRCTG
jgi:hypothetical protein